MTMTDGTLYEVGEEGYTPPIYLEIVDSCPCDANSKWCCGPGADHCGEARVCNLDPSLANFFRSISPTAALSQKARII